ncbi:MAG: thioredoxin domain-containing protein, partial [Gammaproteobacteria bacterium]
MNINAIATLVALVLLQCTYCFAEEKSHSTTNASIYFPSFEFPPGAEPYPKELQLELNKKREQRGNAYQPRTKHLLDNGTAKYTNRLFLESSPYLLQHAHNPVNWYPWGDEAFETAKKLKRPILLSIGYSTCHWCHVMEEESFEDEEIAKFLNENYITIKVDREERPDVDSIYMVAVQTMTGRGGWPMTTWLTHDRKPFYGGTYFPARDGDRGAHIGFLTLIKKLKDIYDKQPDQVAEQSQQLANIISSSLSPQASDSQLPSIKVLHDAFLYYQSEFDPLHGGRSQAPKFPSDISIRFLLRYQRRTENVEAIEMAILTLKKMAAGGIYDHVGGGFHRYSTDDEWLVPHFEKMLYDNALLSMAYLEAYQLTGDKSFLRITKEILRYVKRDMTSPKGAFYSATDADSLVDNNRREEGYFFTWTAKELDQALGKQTSMIVKSYFAITDNGNFEGRNILHTPIDETVIANKLNISTKKLAATITDAKEKLYKARNNRPHPIRDEKILTAWNGLMISAHARAGLILGEQKYIERAVLAAEFIKTYLIEESRLFRSYKDDTHKHNAYLDDYAFYTAATLDLYEATHDIEWLNFAIELDTTLSKYYEDDSNGGFFMTSDDHEKLLVREKPYFDGAEPSGNSVAVLNLLRLYEFTSNDSYRIRAEKALKSANQILAERP